MCAFSRDEVHIWCAVAHGERPLTSAVIAGHAKDVPRADFNDEAGGHEQDDRAQDKNESSSHSPKLPTGVCFGHG